MVPPARKSSASGCASPLRCRNNFLLGIICVHLRCSPHCTWHILKFEHRTWQHLLWKGEKSKMEPLSLPSPFFRGTLLVFFPDDFYANVGIDARGRRSTRASWISHRPTRRAPWASLRFKFGSGPCPRLALALARPALRALSLRPPLVPRPTALRALPDARVLRGGVPKGGDHDPSARVARVHAPRHRARPEWRLRRALGRLRCYAASRPSANLSSLTGPSLTGGAAIQSGKFMSFFLEQHGVCGDIYGCCGDDRGDDDDAAARRRPLLQRLLSAESGAC